MGATGKDFEKWDIMCDNRFRSLESKVRNVWSVFAKFWAIRFINDTRFLNVERDFQLFQTEKAREANGKFEVATEAVSPNQIFENTIMVIRATKIISSGMRRVSLPTKEVLRFQV